MSLFSKSGSLIRNTVRRQRIDRELSEELSSYVELLTEKNMKQGMNERDARRAAMLETGGVEQVKEEVRANRAGFALETLFQDLRYGLRSLRKKPGFTLTAVIALALGIGANTAIFSVVNGVLLRPLTYLNPESIVMMWEQFAQRPGRQNVVSAANFLDWQKQTHALEKLAAVWDTRASVTGRGDPVEVFAQRVSAEFFATLGVQPRIGRWFTADEDKPGQNLVAILSHRLWQERFGGSAAVLGQQATISGRSYTIVGVMPANFHFLNDEVQVWLPLALDPAQDYRTTGHYLRCVGRLASGATKEQADAELNTVAKQLEQTYPNYNVGWSVSVIPLHDQIVGEIRPVLLVLLAAVAFVLLIACANVANLLLARATVRQKEFALRAALGADRSRLVRQMLTESVLLALIGGALGIALAYWGIQLLIALHPEGVPRLIEISIDPRVLIFTFGISLLTGAAFGLLPAIQSSRPDLNNALREGARGSSAGRSRMLRNIFSVAEVSLALVLLVGAGLMMRSFLQLNRVRTGFEMENVLTLRVQLPNAKYPEAIQRTPFFHQAIERIAVLPGVRTVGAISYLPLTGLASSSSFNVVGRPQAAPGQAPGTEVRIIAGSYFKAMGIPLLNGRVFDERDGATSRVAVVNETFARSYFPGEDPIGKQIVVDWKPKLTDEIVGVVADVKETALERAPNPSIYWPTARESYPFMNFVIRTSIDPMQLAAAAEKEIHGIDPDQPVSNVRTLQTVVDKSIARPRFNMTLFGIFAAVALVLASVGLYGVISYSASQRTQEIGIRMALGASHGDIMRLVVGHGMKLTAAGIAIGVIASLALTRVMSNLLFGVTATDLSTFLGVSALLTAVALVANYIPARRATRINPVIALRYE